jgi:hypothetical protein
MLRENFMQMFTPPAAANLGLERPNLRANMANMQAQRMGVQQQVAGLQKSLAMTPTPEQEALQDPLIGPETYGLGGLAKRITALAPTLAPALGLTVFHGSPYKFNKFDMSKIGEGEGAQAFGHGLYFAENPNVAKSYLKPDNRHAMEISNLNKRMTETATLMEREQIPGQYRQFKSKSGEMAAKYYDELMEQRSALLKQKGHLYTADLPDESIAKMLDWDKGQTGLSKEAIASIDAVLEKAGRTMNVKEGEGRVIYEQLERVLGSKEKATEYLKSLGVTGIKYSDAGSRAAKEGTSNFVVFDDKLPKIIKRD